METTEQVLERVMTENRRLRAHIAWMEGELGLIADHITEFQLGIEAAAERARIGGKGEGHGR